MNFKDKILKNQSPWGSGPSGNGSGNTNQPPSLDEIIANIQKKINQFFPGGKSGGSKPIFLGLIILVFLWLASGLYRVLPDEQGVVLRFGKFIKTTQPGLNYHLPLPIERALTPKVTKVNRIDIGFRPASDNGRDSGVGNVPEESLMLEYPRRCTCAHYSLDQQRYKILDETPVRTLLTMDVPSTAMSRSCWYRR